MSFSPKQTRYVDPYSDIYSDNVNHRLISVYPSGKGIIKGLFLHTSPDTPGIITVESGIAIKDFVTLQINETLLDASNKGDNDYYVILRYTYTVISPPPEAELDIVLPGNEDDHIILGKISVRNRMIVGIDYSERTQNDLVQRLNEMFSNGFLNANIDMNNHRIINLASDDPTSFTDPTEAVNKTYVDYVLTNVATDTHVKVDSEDGQSGYLDDKLIVADNLTKEIRDNDLSDPDPDHQHIMLLSGVDNKISVITGDSTSSVLDDKLSVYPPLYKYIIDSGNNGKTLQLNVHFDGEADFVETHNGQKSVLSGPYTIEGETKTALYVADIFVHKTGNVNETISGNKIFTDDITISGNLTVEGTTTTINTSQMTVEDTVVTLNSTLSSGTPPNTLISGIEILRGDEPKATFYWKEAIDRWQFEQPINLHSIHFDYPGSNTDPLSIYRHDIDTDKTALKVQIGDNQEGNDYLEILTRPETGEISLFRVYNNGNAWIKNNLEVGGNVTITGSINGVTIGSAGQGSGLDADTLDGYDALRFVRTYVDTNLPNWQGSNSYKIIGGIQIPDDYGKDTCFVLTNEGERNLHLIIDGEIFINGGSKKVAYNDLTNVETEVFLSKMQEATGSSGNGIDADTIDGLDGSDIALVDLSNVDDIILLNKLKNVDGPDSLLDADTVDGLHSSQFVRSDVDDEISGKIKWSQSRTGGWGTNAGKPAIDLNDSDITNIHSLVFKTISTSGLRGIIFQAVDNPVGNSGYSSIVMYNRQLYVYPDISQNTKFKVWHSGNDGPSSGLNADLLDGLHQTSFLRRDTDSSPSQDGTFDLGSTSYRWSNIYAVYFQGTAVQARYADLAEKYTSKDRLEVGDVVLVSLHNEYDCEKSNEIGSHRVIGVVSKDPAFLMNKELENGIAIALKGRVKCKVKGPVKKGDPLVSYYNGAAISIFNCDNITTDKFNPVFAKALETKSGNDYYYIEVLVI